MPTPAETVQVYYPNSSLTSQVTYNSDTQEASFTFTSTGKDEVVSNVDEQTMMQWLAAPSFGRFYIEVLRR